MGFFCIYLFTVENCGFVCEVYAFSENVRLLWTVIRSGVFLGLLSRFYFGKIFFFLGLFSSLKNGVVRDISLRNVVRELLIGFGSELFSSVRNGVIKVNSLYKLSSI